MIGPKPAAFLRQPLRHAVVIARINVGLFRHRDDLRAQHAQQRDFFRRLRFRNHNHRPVPFRVTDDREPDARVARRPFQDGRAGLQLSRRLGLGDDAQRGPVLHRTARVHEFRLAKDFAAGQLREPPQPDQRRVADMMFNSVITRHNVPLNGWKLPVIWSAPGKLN